MQGSGSSGSHDFVSRGEFGEPESPSEDLRRVPNLKLRYGYHLLFPKDKIGNRSALKKICQIIWVLGK